MQIFVRWRESLCLHVEPDSTVAQLKARVERRTGWPVAAQRLVGNYSRTLHNEDSLLAAGVCNLHTLTLTGSLLGGKGGFGALLRAGARSTVSQNTDACRDLSGRRLRHINADQKLKEWAAGSKERELEKVALQHIKDDIKAAERAAKAEVDVDAARAEHQAGMVSVRAGIEAAVSALPTGSKREAAAAAALGSSDGAAPKRARIFADAVNSGSCSDEDSDDGSESRPPAEAAVVQEAAVADVLQGNKVGVAASRDVDVSVIAAVQYSSDSAATGPERLGSPATSSPDAAERSRIDSRAEIPAFSEVAKQSPSTEAANRVREEQAAQEPVVLGQYESAAALQAVGMARLAAALSAHGLKAGGSLQQRAERLYLLRTTPLADMDRKHFAKTATKRT